MRDSYRTKVYEAERLLSKLHGDQLISFERAQSLLDKLADYWQVPQVHLVRNNKLKRWGAWYKLGVIEAPGKAIAVRTVLHEFAHHLDRYSPDRDGRGHGGSFTEAMLKVVAYHYGARSAEALQKAYVDAGALVGADASRAAAEKVRQQLDRRRERHGEVGDGYAIMLRKDYFSKGSSLWLSQDKKKGVVLSQAGVWRRRSTVERIVGQIDPGRYGWEPKIAVVSAELDTLWTNRWYVLDVIEVEG